MNRITDTQSPIVSRQVRPVERPSPSRPLRGDGKGPAAHVPYGVVDRVTLSPEALAMAIQQRAATPAQVMSKPLTYSPPAKLPATPVLRLPYDPER